jgi:hypothetical protein
MKAKALSSMGCRAVGLGIRISLQHAHGGRGRGTWRPALEWSANSLDFVMHGVHDLFQYFARRRRYMLPGCMRPYRLPSNTADGPTASTTRNLYHSITTSACGFSGN